MPCRGIASQAVVGHARVVWARGRGLHDGWRDVRKSDMQQHSKATARPALVARRRRMNTTPIGDMPCPARRISLCGSRTPDSTRSRNGRGTRQQSGMRVVHDELSPSTLPSERATSQRATCRVTRDARREHATRPQMHATRASARFFVAGPTFASCNLSCATSFGWRMARSAATMERLDGSA